MKQRPEKRKNINAMFISRTIEGRGSEEMWGGKRGAKGFHARYERKLEHRVH